MHNSRWPITPHAARRLRAKLRESLATYRALRRAAVALKAAGGHFLDRELACYKAMEARRWYWSDRRHLESQTVEVGAAWSGTALETVRRANRSR